MACADCPQPAVIHIRTSGRSLCRDHFLRHFAERAKAEIKAQGKLPKGTIAVALSGGKDSMAVLRFLHSITKDRPDVHLAAISVDEGIDGYRATSLAMCKKITDEMGIEWRVVTTKELAGYDIDTYAAGGGTNPTGEPRPACGPCGVFRRTGINRLARDMGAVAVATGHNLDDMAQTVMMNVMNADVERLGRLAPHEKTQPGMVPRLIPFRTIPEKEVLLYALLHDLPLHGEECPYAERANRFAMRDLLWDLEEKTPGTRHKLLAFGDKVRALVPGGGLAGTCPNCGDPTSGAVCKACQMAA